MSREEDYRADRRELDKEWEVTRLRSALENYGRHHDWCASRKGGEPCDCGLSDYLSARNESFMTREWCLAAAEREAATDAP